jgi:hypothetical protein
VTAGFDACQDKYAERYTLMRWLLPFPFGRIVLMAKPPLPRTIFSEEQCTPYPQRCLPFGDSLRAAPLSKESITMQQMQEPEGRSSNEGYPESAGYLTDQDDEQARRSPPQYESQQELQPESEAKLSRTNYVIATYSLTASSFIMALSMALVAFFATATTDRLPNGVFSMLLILLLLSIAGFVLSTIQVSNIVMKQKRVRGAAKGLEPH